MKFTRLFIFLLLFSIASKAQTGSTVQPVAAAQTNPAEPVALPAIMVSTEQAENKLSWYCQYDGVKSIAIQRSADSVRNFTTIGLINAPKKGNGTYKDLHPNVGKNYYRLSIEFGGDLEWFSNTYKVILDSATIAKALQEKAAAALAAAEAAKAAAAAVQAAAERKAESERALKALKEEARLAKLKSVAESKIEKAENKVDKIVKEKAEPVVEPKAEKKIAKKEKEKTKIDPIGEPVLAPPPFTFVPSTKIYTNPYTGHVNIKLEDAWNRRYSIRFYDPSKNEVLRISRVSKPSLVLDKNNFNSRGIYSFQLFDGSAVVDSGFVNIY